MQQNQKRVNLRGQQHLGKTIVACNKELCGGKHYKGIKNAYI